MKTYLETSNQAHITPTKSEINPTFSYTPFQNRQWFTEQINYSDSLLITVGDSWTWGSGISRPEFKHLRDDYDYRIKSIFGYRLADQLGWDWVNIAICGADNTSVINLCYKFVKSLKKPYKKIHIVFTLTECGRELSGKNFLKKKDEYNIVRGASWPTYEELINNPYNLSLFEKECFAEDHEIIYDIKLYQALKSSENIIQFVQNYERYTFQLIKELFDQQPVTYTIAKNYVSTFNSNIELVKSQFVKERFVDVIAERGHLSSYPENVWVLGHIGLEPILDYIKGSTIDSKEELMPLLCQSELGIEWLEKSPYNFKNNGYRHPNEQSHIWWADYLCKHIQKTVLR